MNGQWKLVPVEPSQSILDAMTTERKKGNGVLQMWFEAMAAAPAPPEVHKAAACDHEWTDDGEFLLVYTKCGTQENHDPKWRDMERATKDGTMVRLLVSFDEHSTEDADEAPTIGANNFDNDGEDVWRFAGWCWSHDHFTQGVGTPAGWLPMIDASASTAELDRVTAERDALQERLNAADQRIDEQAGLLRRCVMAVREQHCDPDEAEFDLPAELMADIDAQLSASTESGQDDDWHMNPCKQGHRDVGASGGVAACNQCNEKIEAATTQEAFERWNATHPATESAGSR